VGGWWRVGAGTIEEFCPPTHGREHANSPRLSPAEATSPPFASSLVGENFLIFGSSGSWVCHRSEIDVMWRLVDCQTLGYTRRRSEAKRRRKKYVSLNLVCSYWANLGGYRKIGDAHAHDDLLDDRARHHRINHRRRRYPHALAPDKQPISSRRPHLLHTGRDPGSFHLL